MAGPIRIGVAGALGRMGRLVAGLAEQRGEFVLTARFDRPGARSQMRGGEALTTLEAALDSCDVVVDFSSGGASTDLATRAAARGGPALVIGSTGFTKDEEGVILRAAQTIAIVKSGNFSVGVNVLAGLVEQAARRLGPEAWDVEILEAHHRRKVDAPSGTAKLLAEAAVRGRGGPASPLLAPRDGITGERPRGGVGIAVMRGGGLIGEHNVVFAGEDEILTLSHSARDRSLFAAGALDAAAWVRGRPAGLYDMTDVLGFR